MESSESKTRLLDTDRNEHEERVLCSRCEEKISRRRFPKHKPLLIFGLCQVLVLLLGFAVFALFRRRNGLSIQNLYFDLTKYNVTRNGFGIQNAADASKAADQFWKSVTDSTGLVALDNRWTERMDLPPTVPHPHDPKLKLYQINSFHSLHCLYRIRNRLLSEIPLEVWPRNDIHTMHCIDHIREDLMCNADLSLRGSTNYVSFDTTTSAGDQCRDLDAVQRWAFQHRWSGFFEYMNDVLHLDPVSTEKEVMRQKIELEKEFGRKIPYDQLKVDQDPETGNITVEILLK